MRGFAIVAFCLSVVVCAGVATTGLLAPAAFAQASTPAASPAATTAPPAATAAPAVVEVAATATATAPAEAVVESTATAAAQPAPASTDVVTLVAWYSNVPNNEYLNVVPIEVKDGVAAPAANAKPIGKADFPDNGLPTITWGDTIFNAYLRFEGDVAERWTWFDDSEGARPATLVIQIEGTGGKYQGYFGTASFISRDEGAGGTLVLALRPPRTEAAPAATPAT